MRFDECEIKELVGWKTALHRIPEPSMHEHKTTAFIKARLNEIGTELEDFGLKTGAVAVIRGKNPEKSGETVLLRADIDGIKANETAAVGVKSEHEGMMHACGHDFHTAALLGAAKLLKRHEAELKNDVILLFQPGEETCEGANLVIKNGLFERLRPDRVYGLHNRPEVDCGRIVVNKGPLMAAKDNFKITVTGVGGHSSMPHLIKDPITCAGHILCAVNTIVSRNIDPTDTVVISVCSVHGGVPENLVVDTVEMTGSMRSFDEGARARALERLETIVESTARAFECEGRFELNFAAPAVTNGEKMYEYALSAARKTVPDCDVISAAPCLASEDFALYSKMADTFFFWVGSGVPNEHNPSWHNSDFRTDDRAIETAARLLAACGME